MTHSLGDNVNEYLCFQCEEVIFWLVLGAIYIFSFFNAKEERTRYKYLLYYAFCFCENTALIVVWFLYANDDMPPGNQFVVSIINYP